LQSLFIRLALPPQKFSSTFDFGRFGFVNYQIAIAAYFGAVEEKTPVKSRLSPDILTYSRIPM
jgi:hypothetical protein